MAKSLKCFKVCLLTILAVAVICCSACTSSKDPDENLVEKTMPSNGAILNGSNGGSSYVEVSASNANAYVKVKTSSGTTVVGFFVRSNSTARVSVAPGSYSIQFACGEKWYGNTLCFGSKTSYGQDPNVTLGYGEGVTYSLQLTANGNFSMGQLSASDF